MSIISLQFGQCGNQLGHALYSTLEEDIKSKCPNKNQFYLLSLNKWFNVNKKGEWEPRSILVDTETKVIENMQSMTLKYNNIVAKSFGGSANNWAYGYSTNSRSVVKEVLNCVRSEVEKSDFLTSFLNLYSVSGGTGSGVGSYVIEALRDEFPNKNIVNCAILPYIKGEISTQAYNCLLNLSNLYSVGNSTILFENERILHTCKFTLGCNEVSFSNINSLIAQQLSSVFQPIKTTDAFSILSHLTAHPSYKYLQIRTEPNLQMQNSKFESAQQWTSLMNALEKQSRFDIQQMANYKHHLRSKMISRAIVTRSVEDCPQNYSKIFKESKDFVSWLPREDSLKNYHQNANFLSYKKYISMVYNCNSVFVPLNTIVEDAWTSFVHGAYLHHYKKYGIDEDCFLHSFQVMENVLDDYKNV